jgi:dTDP-4-amino-4,6-dideoxygalactose transaminase
VNYWTGTQCREFEREFAEYHGRSYGVALANGTLALELALRVIGVNADDEVIVTPRSYFASASCIAMLGARPVFADVDRDSQNVTAETIGPLVTSKTRAVIVVHLAGWPCDMTSIMNLASRSGLKIIEDCAQAHGAKHRGRLVGSFGDISCFSFCQDKIMTTAGEGGMLITDERDFWESAWSFKDHGKSWSRVHGDNPPIGFRWVHENLGSNWRLTEIQGAIGRVQLRRLKDWVEQRRHNASRLAAALIDVPGLRVPLPSDNDHHAYYKFYVFLDPQKLRPGWSRDKVLEALEAEGIPGLSGSCPEIYKEKAFAYCGQQELPVAHELGETSLMFLVHPTLSESEINDVIAAVRKVMSVAAVS